MLMVKRRSIVQWAASIVIAVLIVASAAIAPERESIFSPIISMIRWRGCIGQ
jgi:hypothetical protein